MRISLLWLCLFLLVMFPAASTKGQTAQPSGQPWSTATAKPKDTYSFTSTVDAVTPSLLREYAVPGAAVALIQKGRVVWMHGYGFANVASGTRVTAETVFNVGSISKSPTAWAVMQLVEAAKMVPRLSLNLALVYDQEKQKGNANRATLAVARKLVAYLVAIDRNQRYFLVVEKENRTAA